MTPDWTGWLELDLLPSRRDDVLLGAAAAWITLDVAVRREFVTIWIGSRTLAVADRDVLRHWLRQRDPGVPLTVDDIAFTPAEDRLQMTIAGAGPYPLAVPSTDSLVRHV